MKKWTMPFVIALLLGGITAAMASSIPGDEYAPESISMTWDKFMDLWDRSRAPDPQRNREYAYGRAIYTGKAEIDKQQYYIRFVSTTRITAFQARKRLVPVLSSSLNPESVFVNGQSAGWTVKNGYCQVMIQGPGEFEVKTAFTVTIDRRRWPRNMTLPLAPVARTEIEIHVPDGDIEARFDPGVALDTGGDRVHGLVPAASSVAIRWLKRGEKKERIPLKMGAVVHTYVSLGENGAGLKSEVAFQILQGQTHYFRIRVPDSIDILDVTADGKGGEETISQWYTEDIGPAGADGNGKDGRGARLVHIYASYRHKQKFKVRLDCERTETRSDYRFSVPRIEPEAVERYENLVAVGAEANVEIEEGAIERAEGRDVRFLPDEIQAFAKGRALFYYKILDPGFALDFAVKSHDKASVLKTRIERVDADSVVTEAGTVMTKAAFQVKNNQAQFLRLRLPDGAKLISAFTSGKEIQPAREGGVFLIPLDKSTQSVFPVEIAWLTEIGKFRIAGKNSVSLPATDISIGELSWRLYTPHAYQVYYFAGNVDFQPTGIGSAMGMILGQAAGGHTRSAFAGGGASKSYRYNEWGLKKRFKTGREFSKNMAEQAVRSGQVQVQIPVSGKQYRFTSYLVKGFTPVISFYYVNGPIKNTLSFLAGLLALAFTVWIFVAIFERSSLPRALRSRKACLAGLGVATLFGACAVVFKFGIITAVANALFLGIIGFAVFQNRRHGVRFHEWATGWKSRFPEAFLILLLLLLLPMVISGQLAPAAAVCLGSILFHVVFFKGLLFLKRKRVGQSAAKTALLIFLASGLLQAVPDAFASSPGTDGQADSRKAAMAARDADTWVTLGWDAVKNLLEAIAGREKDKQNAPGVPYLFGAAHIQGEITENFARLDIRVPLTLFGKGFFNIPLVSPKTPVSRALYNGVDLPLSQDGRKVFFEAGADTDAKGVLQLEIVAPVTEKGGVSEFSIDSPLLQGGLLTLSFGADIKTVQLFDVSWQKREGRVVTAALGSTNRLRGELATFLRKQESADETDKRVKKRYAVTYTLVSLEDEVATFYSSIRYRILNEEIRNFQIQLPESAVVHEIVGEDMERWRAVGTQNGVTTYQVDVMYPVADRYDLSVRYETPVPSGNAPFVIPCLMVEGVARDAGYIGIEMRGRGEISIQKLEKARAIDIRELPAIIRSDADAPFVYAFRYIERPYDIALSIQKHEGYKTDPAIADRIVYTRVISPKGKVLSQARMWIRNSRKQYAAFHLPEGARIMSTFLDEKSVKPSIGEKQTILLPLKRQSATPFVLDVVFEEPDVAVKSLWGRIDLSCPMVDIPASIVQSDIYVPEKMKPLSPSGDFREIQPIDFVPWASSSTNLFLDAGSRLEGDEQTAASAPAQVADSTAGAMSLKINLPFRGRMVSMNTFYIPALNPLKTRIFLIHKNIWHAGYGLAVCVFLLAGWLAPGRKQSLRLLVPSVIFLGLLYLLFSITFKLALFCLIAGWAGAKGYGWWKNRGQGQPL